MRKLLQEKGSVFKKIMSWILVMVILFTSADMSAFVVAAEEQNEIVLSDGSSDSNEISSEIQQNDSSVSEQETLDSSVTEESEEQLQMDTPEEEQLFSDGAEEIQPEEEVLSDGTESDTELAANTKGNPVQWSTMSYNGGRIYLSYRYKGVNHSNRNYPWIYGKDAATSELHVAYCIEPDVDDITKWYTLHNKPLTEHPTFKNDPAKAKRMLEYAYFGAEYPGHWSTNELQAEYFMAAQELIWEELGVSNISWHRQTSGGGAGASLNSVVDTRKAEIKRLINEFNTKPVFENTTLYQDKSDPNKIYTIKLKSGSLSPWGLSQALPSGGVLEYGGYGSKIQFKLNPDMVIRSVRFDYTKAPSKYADMMYYLGSGQQTVIVSGTLPALSVSCTANVVPISRVKIKKTDDTGAPVSGVTFKYGTSKTNLDQVTKPTDEKGETEIRLEKADVNTIYVQEHEVPPHLIKSDEIKTVTFTTGGTGTVTFVNDRVRYPVTLEKVEAGTGQPLSGAKFKYWDKENPETTYTAVTDGEGRFTSTVTFAPGTTVVMEEVSAPEGYLVPESPDNRQELVISTDQSKNVFRFENSVKSARLMIEKYNERTGDPILDGVGCTFKVGTDLSNPSDCETLTIGPDGTATSSHTYKHNTLVYYQEISAPEGFELDDTVRSIVIDASKSTVTEAALNKVRVPNKELTLHLKIRKKGSDGLPLQGVRFRLEQRKGDTWYTIESNLVTDRNGTVEIPGTYKKEVIVRGELRLVEEETIPGYKLLDKPIVIDEKYIQTESSEIVIEITNKKLDTRFQVYKYGTDTKKPLAGAVFEITDEDGDLLQTLTTNSKGIAETTELLADVTYYIEEIEAPKGYQKIEGRHPFVISTENGAESSGEYFLKREVPNEPYRGRIKVKKVNQDGLPLSGIEFTIYKGALAVEKLTTDEKGEATSDWLTADSAYRIKETYTPPQFEKTELLDYTFDFLNVESQVVGENWKVDVTKNDAGNEITAYFEVTNKELLGRVTIKKVDADEPDLAVQGATFELYNRYDKKTLLASGVTDETGTVVFKDLPIVNPSVNAQQGHYYLEETTPGENHVLPENTGKYFSLTTDQLNYEVMFKNPPVKGSVEILKVDKDNPDKKLEGAEFAIYRADDLNTVLKTEVTGKDGIARFEDLRYGEYVIKETKSPLYYRNDPVTGGNKEYWNEEIGGYCVTIKENGQLIPLTITNPKLQVRVKVIKYAEGKITTLGGAEFNLCKADGTILETLVTSPVDGTVYSKNYYADELGEGAYLIETKAPAGYEPSTDKIFIEFDQNSENPILEIVKEVENGIKEPEFKFQKVDENGNGVEAQFSIEVYNMSKNIHWSQYGFEYSFTTTKENTFADLSEFYDKFNYMLERYGDDNRTDHIYMLTFKETKVDKWHQPVEGKLAQLQYSLTSSGWTVEPYGEDSLGPGVTFDYNTMVLTAVNKQIPIKLNIVKRKQGDDIYLEGAVFRITPIGQEDKAVEVTSTSDPEGVAVELPYAEQYKIEEIQAPQGYWSMGDGTISIDRFQLEQTGDGPVYTYKYEALNVKQPELKIIKTGTNGSEQKPLKAEFRITEMENSSGKGKSITVTTQDSDGIGIADFTPFTFLRVSTSSGKFKIEEISVGDTEYKLLETPFYLEWSAYYGTITFKLSTDTSLPDGVSIEKSENNLITIAVENRKKNYSFNMVKQGDPDDNERVWADIIISVNGFEYERTISSEDLLNVDDIFSGLTDSNGYWIRIEEKDTTAGYEKVPVMGFWYYPDEKGLDKFQGANGPVSFEVDEQDSEKIIIKLTNERSKMRLLLKKTDEGGGVLAGAKFRITTEYPDFEQEYVTTGNPDGEVFEFPYAQNITLEEIQPPPGYEMGEVKKWTLTAADFTPTDSTQSVYECDRFLKSPIENKGKYDLTVKKTDGDGQAANATFKITANDGINKEWQASTKEGSASLNFIVDELLKDYPDRNIVNLTVTEIATDDGLQLRQGNLATIVIHLDRIRGAALGQYFELRDFDNSFIKVDFASTGLEFIVKNEFIPVNLTLIKKEEGKENVYLAGAEFTITVHGGNSDGKQITVETTDTSAGETVKLPWADSYSVQETKAPEGYILDPTVYDYTLEDFQNEMDSTGKVLVAKNHSVTMTNTVIMGNLRIRKMDQENGELLSGAEFEIRKGVPPQSYEDAGSDQYEKVGIITIGMDGTGEYNNIPYGKYFMREIKAPEGYQISRELLPFAIEKDQQIIELDIPNQKLEGELTIVKVDSEDNQKPLAGAVFTIHRKDTGKQVGDELITNMDGRIGPISLPYGEYYIKEVRFPAGYGSATGKTYPFELNQKNTVHVETIENTKANYGLRIYKRDSETRDLLAGAVFGVFEKGKSPQNADPIVTFKSNASGIATVLLSNPGDYDIYELTPPPGYELLTEKIPVHVDNSRQKLAIEIKKQEEGSKKPLAGAVFEIRNEKTGALIATTDPTNENGEVTVEVPAGNQTYTVTEIKAPEGYVLDSTPHKVTVTKEDDGNGNIIYEAEPLVIDNRLIKGNIKLVKVDETDRTIPLAGAVFEVRNESGERVDELTTNSQGEAMSKELAYGKYTLVETQAPDGYELSEQTYEAELSEAEPLVTVTATNARKKGGFVIKKVDAQKPETILPEAEFTIFKSSEDAQNQQNAIEKQTTGADGLARFEQLDYGTYYIRETKAPEGYQLNNRIMAVTVDKDWKEAEPLVAEDYPQPQEGYFRVVKTDKSTGSTLAGAEFTVTGPDGYSKVYKTDKSGAFQTDALKPGMYTVTETKAPDGYYISDQPSKTVEVKAGAGTLVEMQEAVFENEQILMPIRIKKTDGDKKDPKPLVGAEFKVYRLEGTDGQSKTEVDTLVTDMHGEAVSRLLPAGSYEVVETQPPKGYELAENPSQKVTINKDSTEETLTFTFVNEILKGTLKIRKVDSETKKVLPGAVFEAYSTEFGVYYRATSADDGYAVFENLPYGIYRIREVEAPEGYELNSDFEKYVEIGKDSPEGGAEITLEVPNTPLMGEIQLTKKDAETGEILEGAIYGIYTRLLENGDIDPTSHMDGYDMVTKAPHVTSKKLSYGTYYVKEITPPDGYKVNDKVYTVTFKENIPLVAIEAEDEAYKGSISVVKKDSATDQPLEGVIFAIFTAEEYEKYQKYQEEGSGDIEELSPIYLTTDETGQASTGNILELGQEYVMVEYAPPAGYDPPVNEDGSEKVWRFTPTKDEMIFEYEIENTKQREIIIHKTDENGNPVNGVVFGLFSYGTDGKPETDDDKEIAQFATAIDGSGIARYETDDLPNGWYYVKELSCGSAGYEMSKEIVPIEITDDKREYEFDFINYKPRAEIAIQKRDEFGRPLAGARFGLYQFTPDWQEKTDFEEDLIQEFEMDENGYGKIENLLCDLYVIREIEAPQGYRLMEPILVDLLDVEDDIDETKSPKPSEDNVKMTDSGSGISTDWQEEDSPVHITKGEKNGRTYYYYLHNLYNEPLTGWIEIHKEAVSEDGSPIEKIDLSNARFQIIEESGKVVDTVITDQFGRAKSRELPLGTYIIREIQAPDGTQLNGQEGTVVIDGTGVNDIYTYTHKNKIVMGQLKIKKADPAGKALAGAQFAIYAESGSDGEPVDSITTGEDGTATSKLLPYGWYIVRETKAPEGYELDTNLRLRCRISENEQIVEFTVMNYPGNEPGIYIVKYDKDNPNKYLEGAQFDLYKDSALTEKIGGPYVTEENGQVKITDTDALNKGETYYLKETRAPEGYQLDETAHSFVWGETTTIALYIPNEKEKGYIRFEKTGEMLSEIKDDLSYPNLKELVWEQQQLSGAQIGIYATEEIELDGKTYQPGDLIVRLESGETSPGLPLGTYEYQELSAPPSYILDTQRHKVEVTETTTQIEPAFVSLENQHASVNLQLYKKFSDENTSEKLKQVKFGVYTVGTITSGKVQIEPDTLVGVFGVDENGFANPELKLPQGSYYVRELETADGYLLDETRYPFKVVYDNGNEKIIISSKENPIVNEPIYGVIRLEKKGELFTQVEVSIEENKYQVNRPVFTQGELNGAKVEIRAKETVTIGDSTYQPGEVIDTLISGEKPESRKLPVGTYTVVEVEAPDGYVLDSTPRDVTIRAPEEGSHVHTVELVSLTNAKKKVDLNLYKSFFGLEIEEAKELYQKVLFGVYAAEDIPGAADGVSLKKDTLVELIRIEADGSGGMEKALLPAGNYYVKELETADGYQVDDTHYPFSVSFGKDVSDTENSDTGSDTITVEVEGIDAEHPLINLPEGAEVPFAFRKIGEDGQPLAGAVFRLYTCKEEHEHSQEAGTESSCWEEVHGLSPKTSGADGIVDFGILPNGTYQLKETEAPEGYVLPAGQWRFTVNSEAEPGEHIIFTPTGGAQPPAFQKAEEDAVYQYQVMNRKARQMPFTGGTGMLDYAAGGGALLALAELVNRRRKKKNKGNVQ